MSAVTAPTSKPGIVPVVTLVSWAVVLAASILPDILWLELTGVIPAWLHLAKVGCAAAFLVVTLAWPTFKPLRGLALVLLALLSFDWGIRGLFDAWRWEARLVGTDHFIRKMLVVQGPRLTLALLMSGFLWLLTGSRRNFFLEKGNLNAAAAPIPLITNKPVLWNRLGPILSLALTSGLILFMILFGSPLSVERFIKALPLVPFILLFAAMNAYGEELTYRASFLAVLEGVVGPRQTLLITAAFFGVMHYFGMPYGVLGVVMSAFVGWLMGKAMLETRGFFWAWWIHFCMDVGAFLFIAMGSITPSG